MEENSKAQKHIEELKKIYNGIVVEIDEQEAECEAVKKRMIEIEARVKVLNENIGIMSHKKGCLDVLLDEIDIGYDKILASSQCLSVLASRKLRMLKRKYSKYI
jgi:septal ring factor EnvC (AmiA/AmiB activator)